MTPARHLRRALAIATAGAILTALPAAAFGPTTDVVTGDPGQHLVVSDLASRAGDLFMSVDRMAGSNPFTSVHWSTDGGSVWDNTIVDGNASRESQATLCAGDGLVAYAASAVLPSADWEITVGRYTLDGLGSGSYQIAPPGANRKPDIACIANTKVAVAWFQNTGSGFKVKLYVRRAVGEELSPQSLTVGDGSVAKGLAVAATSGRVYVAWVDGTALKLRRYAVGPAPSYTLSSLGTATVVTHSSVRDPELSADGQRLVLAYQHRADVRVRRSSDRGVSLSGPVTVRDLPYPSEVGASPTSLSIVGTKVVLGVLELGGIETLTGKGIGFVSTNGGASWATRPKHLGGRTVATLIRISGNQRYAEAWDQSISQPATEHVRFRRE